MDGGVAGSVEGGASVEEGEEKEKELEGVEIDEGNDEDVGGE